MISKNRSSVANVVNWSRPKWRGLETARSSRWCVAVLRSDATILVHAAPAKSTRSAAAQTPSQWLALHSLTKRYISFLDEVALRCQYLGDGSSRVGEASEPMLLKLLE